MDHSKKTQNDHADGKSKRVILDIGVLRYADHLHDIFERYSKKSQDTVQKVAKEIATELKSPKELKSLVCDCVPPMDINEKSQHDHDRKILTDILDGKYGRCSLRGFQIIVRNCEHGLKEFHGLQDAIEFIQNIDSHSILTTGLTTSKVSVPVLLYRTGKNTSWMLCTRNPHIRRMNELTMLQRSPVMHWIAYPEFIERMEQTCVRKFSVEELVNLVAKIS